MPRKLRYGESITTKVHGTLSQGICVVTTLGDEPTLRLFLDHKGKTLNSFEITPSELRAIVAWLDSDTSEVKEEKK